MKNNFLNLLNVNKHIIFTITVVISFLLNGYINNANARSSKLDRDREHAKVTIISVPSLILPLSEVATKYTKQSGIAVNIDFDSAAELIFKIENGDPADIFISDHDNWTKSLKEKGLIDSFSITNLAENSLVIAANNSFAKNATLPQLAKRIALVSSNKEESSLGLYFDEFLQKEGLEEKVNKYLIKVADSEEVIKFIVEGQKAGAIFASDSKMYLDKMNILNYQPNINVNYSASVVVSENMSAARNFMDFLQSNDVKLIFTRYGFKV